jgi:FtsH-binding integral membrane protein
VAASSRWSRLVATSVAASALTFVSQAMWRGPWIWWGSVVAGLGLTLFFAASRGARAPAGPAIAASDRNAAMRARS